MEHSITLETRGADFSNPQAPLNGARVRDLPEIAAHLRQCSAVHVRLEYNGRNGSGMFTALRIVDGESRELAVRLPERLRRSLLAFFRELLETRYPNWAHQYGACGDFGWHLVQHSLAHVHRVRYLDYDTTRIEGL